MKNPFKVGDKVLTKVGDTEVEGVVTKLWQNEVQVRTPDNELRWRTVYTVWYPGAPPVVRQEKSVKTIGLAVGAATTTAPKTAPATPHDDGKGKRPTKATSRSKSKESGKRSRKRH